MNLISQLALATIAAFFISYITIPVWTKFAERFNFVDKPNKRKVHHRAIPLVGGIAIFVAMVLANFVRDDVHQIFSDRILGAALIMLILGAIDDKMHIRAIVKLIVQIICAVVIIQDPNTTIHSFYGIFGLYEIPPFFQYLVTTILIVGVINAINLLDGIDGLAGSFISAGAFLFFLIAIYVKEVQIAFICGTLSFATLAFLRYNFSARYKIFMGDAGSLSLGFILVVVGIQLINRLSVADINSLNMSQAAILGIFLLPVIDSVRVYIERLRAGRSPFLADKRHFHHLFLKAGMSHKWATFYIMMVAAVMVVIIITSTKNFSISVSIFFSVVFYMGIATYYRAFGKLMTWTQKIEEIERTGSTVGLN